MSYVVKAILCSILFSVTTVAVGQDSSVIDNEWQRYVKPMESIGAKLVPLMDDSDDPRLRQELYQMIFSGLSVGYLNLLQTSPEYPEFTPLWNQTFSFFSANPDNTYYASPVEAEGVYRISGYRGSVRIVNFQVADAKALYNGKGPFGPTYASYDLDDLEIGQDGYFEVVLSVKRPSNYDGNWWKLNPNANYIVARQIAYDWANEVDGRFAIERLNKPAIKPRLTTEQLSAKLEQIAQFAENWTEISLKWTQNYINQGLINKVVVQDLDSQGGLVTQKYIEGIFDISTDEALIYEVKVPEQCRFWNIELSDIFWKAMDYTHRQSSLNGFTAVVDDDGIFRAVISAQDPGVPNWLDNSGYQRGIVFGRWTDCSSYPQPVLKKVKVAEVRKYLPANTEKISAEQRDTALRKRREAAQLRRKW